MKTNHALLTVVISLSVSLSLLAQAPYKLPPQEVIDMVEAPPTPRAALSPGIYASTRYSPDGAYLLVHRIKQPYSYMVTYRSFAHAYEVWDRDGQLVRTIADLPLAEEVPLHGVAQGPRHIDWRALAPATLTWVEALDGGDPEKEVEFRDRVMMCPAPFSSAAKEIFHAIKGHGATAKLVMLPNESHGYRARESVLHVLAEMFDWFDEHVKHKK